MDPPIFYHYVKASGLVFEDDLERVLEGVEGNDPAFWQVDPFLTDLSAEPVDRRHLQKPARLRGAVRHVVPPPVEEEESRDATEASLDGESARREMDGVTDRDHRLADELIRRGFLNRWQTTQLFSGRTKFTLGDFRILDAIGRGGYGHVFLGRTEQGGRKQYIALKVLPLARANPDLTKRFLHEIEVQKNLSHLNLVRFLGSGRDGNVHYMVHEFVDGGDLRELFRSEGVLPIEVVAPVLGQIARAVHYLHENGIVHRDIKPANVLLSDSGFAKLADMGLSVTYDRHAAAVRLLNPEDTALERQIDSVTKTTKVAGTVDYMAPDQILKPSEPMPGWDIYSLGCTLYQLLTGEVPFPQGDTRQKLQARLRSDPKDVRILNPTISFDIADLLRGMLARNSAERITAREVAERLDAWSPGTGIAYRITCGEDDTAVTEPPMQRFPHVERKPKTIIPISGRG